MKRLFYTDPLAAAWMAKHFGMRIIHLGGADWPLKELTDLTRSVDGFKYVVHADSMHLLLPRKGDIINGTEDLNVCGKVIDSQFDGMLTLETFAGNFGTYVCNRIIQRDGKPFHWPESECA